MGGTGADPRLILYVGGSAALGETLAEELGNCVVRSVTAVDPALSLVADRRVACVVSEYDLGGGDGLELLQAVRARWPALPFVLVPTDGSERLASHAVAAGVTDYIPREMVDERSPGDTVAGRSLADRVGALVGADHTRPGVERGFSRFRSVLEESPVPIGVYDDDAVLRYLNPAGVDFLCARDEHDVVGRSVASFVHPEDRERAVERTRRVLEERVAVGPTVLRFVDQDGATKHAKVAAGPVTYREAPAGQVILNDITELVRHERELERKNERLDEFASIVTHDLRNPLEVAKGRLELYRSVGDEANLDEAETALDRIEAIVGDVLLLARLGEDVTDRRPVPLSTAVDQSQSTVDDPAITVAIPEDVAVLADPGRFQQLLENLLHNAAEHGDATTVTVGTERVDREGRTVEVLYVADDGTGIPDDDREAVFDPGYTTAREGTGFGLGIVERIAEAHGWSVHLTASEAGGARFEFSGVEFDRS